MSLHNLRLRVQFACALIFALLMLGAGGPVHAQGGTPDPSSRATQDCFGQPATIVGTQGDDTIKGTDGEDVIVTLGGDDAVRGLGGFDLICGGSGADSLFGGKDGDFLFGEQGNDKLYGGGGDFTDFAPGPGDDLVVGSDTADDFVHFEDATGPITASLVTQTATGQGHDTMVSADGLLGGSFDDRLIGDGNDNDLAGRAGDDTLIGHGGGDSLSGQQDDDIYRGGPGFDVAEYYDQAAADERVIGPMNVNLRTGIATGDGTDTLSGIEGATGSDKADTMIGDGKGNSFFWLFGGDDTVRAGGGNDFVESSVGANALSGGAGRDLVAFLDGKDFDHQHPAVTVDLGAGTSSGGDTLTGFEDVFGSIHNDTLIGDDGPNRLYGYTGDDVLKGRAGDDVLDGMDGSDRAYGGKGTDRCRAETKTNCESVSRDDRARSTAFHWRHLVEFALAARRPLT